ncbi:MAG TPA: tetratricopeptide repeat protein, partial [Opitutus sp.]|nr:tetratricopeptide repeat protein [Opitutus sp.]
RLSGGREQASALPLIVALLWALHPLQTAAVTYIVQRAELLAGLFYLLTLYAFLRSVAPDVTRPRGWRAVSVIACVLGVGTKEIVATAPLLIFLFDRAFVAGSLRAAWRARGRLHLALASTWLPLAALVVVNRGRGGSAGLDAAIGAWPYFLTQCEGIVRYLALVFWPASQVFDYGTTVVAGLPSVLPELVLSLALGAVSLWALRRNHAAGFLGTSFFLLLAPSSSFVPVATQTLAEHRMYLPLAPVVLLAVLGARGLAERFRVRGLALAFAAAAMVTLGIATFVRNRVYQTELRLWSDTVAKRPGNARAHTNLGLALFRAGRASEAEAAYRRTLELQPNHAFARFNLGALLLAQQQWARAEEHFRAALAADPQYVSARVNLGRALAAQGRRDEAVAEYRTALAADPGAHDAAVNLAALLAARGELREAETLLQAAVAGAPAMPEAHYHLALLLEKKGASAAAEAELRAAIGLRPTFAEAHLALGNTLARRDDAQEAETHLREAIRLEPGLAEAHYALGNLFAKAQQFEPAIAAYDETLRLDPAHVQARANLGNCQLVTGRVADAIANYEQVLRVRPADNGVRRNLEMARELWRARGSGR